VVGALPLPVGTPIMSLKCASAADRPALRDEPTRPSSDAAALAIRCPPLGAAFASIWSEIRAAVCRGVRGREKAAHLGCRGASIEMIDEPASWISGGTCRRRSRNGQEVLRAAVTSMRWRWVVIAQYPWLPERHQVFLERRLPGDRPLPGAQHRERLSRSSMVVDQNDLAEMFSSSCGRSGLPLGYWVRCGPVLRNRFALARHAVLRQWNPLATACRSPNLWTMHLLHRELIARPAPGGSMERAVRTMCQNSHIAGPQSDRSGTLLRQGRRVHHSRSAPPGPEFSSTPGGRRCIVTGGRQGSSERIPLTEDGVNDQREPVPEHGPHLTQYPSGNPDRRTTS